MTTVRKLWIGLFALIVLSPLGVILPHFLKARSAWGEWGADETHRLVGYVPQGLKNLANLWTAPLPEYAFKGWEGKGLPQLSFAYIISAILGIGLTACVMYLFGKFLEKKE